MTPQSRIQALRNLGVEVTPEREAREYRITLDTIARKYGEEWELVADAIHPLIEAAEAGDVTQDSWAEERLDNGLTDDVPYRRGGELEV